MMSFPAYMYLADGSARLVDSAEEEAAAIASGWAHSPADFGIETCPGAEPDSDIAAKRATPEPEVPKHAEIDMPADGTPLSQMTREQLIELAANRTVKIDKRWGDERIREALAE